MKTVTVAAALLAMHPAVPADDPTEKPLTPVEARKRVNEKITLQMVVKASKDRLEKHREIYLDSEADFKDEKNMAVVINEEGAARFRKAGVADPAGHFKGKTIRVTGTVTLYRDRPRIVVSDPSQIRIVGQKDRRPHRAPAGWKPRRQKHLTAGGGPRKSSSSSNSRRGREGAGAARCRPGKGSAGVAGDAGDLVLDPFVGTGTTLAVAKALGRRWLGAEKCPATAELARTEAPLPGLSRPGE